MHYIFSSNIPEPHFHIGPLAPNIAMYLFISRYCDGLPVSQLESKLNGFIANSNKIKGLAGSGDLK
jgi:hypothetical protein